MNMIGGEEIKETISELLKRAVTLLPIDFELALENAYENETSEIERTQLKAILDNERLAKESMIPMCQDTGIFAIYFGIGTNATVDLGAIGQAVNEGVAAATKLVPLRPNAVHPITRKNPGTNVGVNMPSISYDILPGKKFIKITVFPKGAGSENMSTFKMLTPSQGVIGVKNFVLEGIAKNAKNACPPGVVGIVLGGTADLSMSLAKRALLRPIGSRHKEPEMASLEEELLKAINALGVGPMGLGGKTTMLDVHVEYGYTHTASLPVAINIQCWAGRQATARIYEDGRKEFL